VAWRDRCWGGVGGGIRRIGIQLGFRISRLRGGWRGGSQCANEVFFWFLGGVGCVCGCRLSLWHYRCRDSTWFDVEFTKFAYLDGGGSVGLADKHVDGFGGGELL